MDANQIPVVRLGDVVDRVTKGTTPTTHGYQYTKDGVAFVRVENLRNGFIDSSTLTSFISVDADRFLKRSSLEEGDVLVSIAGTIGRTAVVREHDLPANTNQAVAIIRGANKRFEPAYLRYALESPLLNRLLTGEARGGAMQNISLEDVKNVRVPAPPLDQQCEIVAEIEKQFTRLETGVAGLRRVQVNLKRYRAAVLKAACEGSLFGGTVREVSGAAETTYGPLADLPIKWRWTTPREVCDKVIDCHNKTAPYSAFGIPLIRTTNIRDGKVDLTETRFVDQPTYEYWSRRCYPQPGDVLFTREAPMGEVGIIPHGAKVCMGQRIMLMRTSKHIANSYLLIALQAPQLKTYIDRTAVGSGVKHLRVKDVEDLPLPLPPLEEQQLILAEVERRVSIVEELETAVEANLRRAYRLRQAILQRVFERNY